MRNRTGFSEQACSPDWLVGMSVGAGSTILTGPWHGSTRVGVGAVSSPPRICNDRRREARRYGTFQLTNYFASAGAFALPLGTFRTLAHARESAAAAKLEGRECEGTARMQRSNEQSANSPK